MENVTAELDLHQPSTLYWKAVPVFVKRSDKDERSQDLTLRVLAGFQRANHAQRVLRIYMSNESDLFFLYVLEVNEDDFAALKLDQGILVDFVNFPGKIIGLLEKCIACKSEELPRFQAVLQTYGGQCSFKLVETNDFKQLPHITLLFRPGNDAAVKQFLAFRLTELSADCQQLSSELSKAQSERNVLQSSLTETKRQLASTKEQHDKYVMEFEADVKNKEAQLAEAKSREVNDLREQHLRERAEAEKKHQEQLSVAQHRVSELDSDNRTLRQHKYELDTRVSELSHKLGAAEGLNRSLGEEVERLRALTQQLSRDKAERDVEIGEALTKVAALEDKVDSQRAAMAQQADRIRGMEASLRQVEARAEELKATAQGHEARANEAAGEVLKANEVIKKLSNKLQQFEVKRQKSMAIIARQEEELTQRDSALDEGRQQARNLQRELDRATSDAESLKQEVEELKRKLDDSKKQLQGNEQMIRWLNNQITESQLHYSGASGLGSSRYTFRPSNTVPSTMPGPAGIGGGGIGGGLAGSTLSTGAAPTSMPRSYGTYRTPTMPAIPSGSVGQSLGADSTGVTPTGPASSMPRAAAAGNAPGSGGSTGFQSSIYTGGSGYSGYSRHSTASGGGGNSGGIAGGGAGVTAARSLNLGGMPAEGGGGGTMAAAATGLGAKVPSSLYGAGVLQRGVAAAPVASSAQA